MRLVIEYGLSDGCTYSCTNTIPIEYESPEAFLVDFENSCREHKGYFNFAGVEWDSRNFFEFNEKTSTKEFITPEILTVDEWFERGYY